jgi:cytochrome c oxidase subunit 4
MVDTHSHDDHGHGGVGKYIAVFVALCVLTAISFAIGNTPSIMRTPSIGWTGMIAVSCGKAMLVILFFMHLKWEANWKYVLTVPASIMSIFLMLMLVPDVGRRTRYYAESRWLHAAVPEAKAEALRAEVLPTPPPAKNAEGDEAHKPAGH